MTYIEDLSVLNERFLNRTGEPPKNLIERVGETHFRQRTTIELHHAGDVFGRGRTLFHIENADWMFSAVYAVLKMTGLARRGMRNVLDIQVVENIIHVPNLPPAFSGFTILQISDLHIGMIPELIDSVIARIKPLDYDFCAITGDYRWKTTGSDEHALEEMARLIPHLKQPAYAILGNHDFLEFVPPVEAMGLPFLLNETVILEREGQHLYISGVDDPHFYETENLQKTGDEIPWDAVSILLAHSPEIYRQAAAAGYDIVLSGHTHVGQFCLPGHIPLVNNANCPRYMVSGPWQFHHTQGYTSSGTGSSGMPARFNCPPEVTLHKLYAAK